MEVTVWYDEPEVINALFEALKAEQALDVGELQGGGALIERY